MKIPRYKLAVQVFFGEMKGQGLRIGSKCLWDQNFDNWASYTFTNESIHCTGIVFGVYTEWGSDWSLNLNINISIIDVYEIINELSIQTLLAASSS